MTNTKTPQARVTSMDLPARLLREAMIHESAATMQAMKAGYATFAPPVVSVLLREAAAALSPQATGGELRERLGNYATAVANNALAGYAHVDGLGLRHLRGKDTEEAEQIALAALLAALSAPAIAPAGMCEKGQAFKDYVHQRLDAMGVPHSVPESEHDKAGCRIGGRLDFVEAAIAPGGCGKCGAMIAAGAHDERGACGPAAGNAVAVRESILRHWLRELNRARQCESQSSAICEHLHASVLAALTPQDGEASMAAVGACIAKHGDELVELLTDPLRCSREATQPRQRGGYLLDAHPADQPVADDIIAMIERELPGYAWSLSKITNDTHIARPFGAGFAVTLNGPQGAVWEKAETLDAAARNAIKRAALLAAQEAAR